MSPTDLITVAGSRLHVCDTGPRGALAVVLWHGFGSSAHTWEPWARVRKLVLISPDGFVSPGFAYDQPAEVPAVMGRMRFALPEFMLRMSLAPADARPARLLGAPVTRYRDLNLAPGSRYALLARTRQTVLEDPLPILRHNRVPTLVRWGAVDQMIPATNAGDCAAAIPNERVVTLPDAGRRPRAEAPRSRSPP